MGTHVNASARPASENAGAVLQRWADLWSSGDLAHADQVFTGDVRDHRTSPSADIFDIEGEKSFIASIRAAFPDLQVEIADTVAEGDRIAARVLHRGTHLGTFLHVAPTGRRVSYEGTVILRIVEDRIGERWGTVDIFGILLQLGAAAV